MKRLKDLIKTSGLWALLFVALCSLFGIMDGGVLCAGATITPEAGGAIVVGEGMSVTRTHEDVKRLLLDTIDEKVTKIRPHDVVIDTISRNVADVKTSNNQTIRHYAIDVIELSATVTTAITGNTNAQEELNTSDNGIFALDQTIFCEGINGYLEDGVTIDANNRLMLYVVGISSNNHPLVVAVNGKKVSGVITVPPIAANTIVTRGGRAGSESQIQTDAYSGIPTDSEQYLQKFMTQIEQTTLFDRADKEVDWEFTDAEEQAVYDMKHTQNISYWIGIKRRIKIKNSRSKKAEDVYFTGGIWNQAGKEYSFGGNPVDENNIVGLMKVAFTGNASSKQKLLIIGSDLLEKFEQIDYKKVVYVGARKQAYGLEFTQIV